MRRDTGTLLILLGFGFVFIGSLLDITDNFDQLDKYKVVGDTEYQAFLEKVVGYLFGFCLLALGFWKWLPSVTAHRRMEATLASANVALRRRNLELEEARNQASTDELTGLLNYRAFHVAIRQEALAAQAANVELSLIMLDVDDFKELNDASGHQQGNHFLTALAGVIVAEVKNRPAFRYGGDEFTILLPEQDRKGAVEVAERLRLAVNLLEIEGDGRTISLGVASLSESRDSVEELVYRADSAMFQAKAAGRNRVDARIGPEAA